MVMPYYQDDLITLYLADCLPAMRKMPDKAFDLAICDPPYGNNLNGGRSEKDGWNSAIDWAKCNNGWNLNIPKQEYFIELRRVSSNQMIWGGNYFANILPNSECWLIWDKGQRDFSLADGEMAWTSFDKAMRIYSFSRARANQETRIHPTQKPVALYRWLLKNYAKPGDSILDTHFGSGSIAIACHDLGFTLTAFEIDEEYLSTAVDRIKRYLRQPKMFKPVVDQPEQESFL